MWYGLKEAGSSRKWPPRPPGAEPERLELPPPIRVAGESTKQPRPPVAAGLEPISGPGRIGPTVWRFAYDSAGLGRHVQRAIEDLRCEKVDYSRIRVYLLFNFNESPREARSRAEEIIAWGASPWPMAYRPLDWEDED